MLRVLVIDDSAGRAADICAGLALAGHQVAAVLASSRDLPAQVAAVKPDIILIETEAPSRDTLEHLAAMDRDAPRPVVVFARESGNDTIRAAIKAGVAAYVVDGLDPERLKPVIEVAIARFEEYQSLKAELAQATRKLSDRKRIERAKGLLMKSRGMDEDAAYAALRKLAMDRNKALGEVAQDVLDMA
ncbi:MAG: ANTAR domain-containing protein, partial [Rhodocyclaceae bacterium]|nr:ANTAR domain-containing protein [Rhodocyclaceae bacterium]